MSIHLNTNQPTSVDTPAASKEGFWKRCDKLAAKMQEKQALPSLEYCTRKWVRKNNALPTEEDKASATFQRCMEGHRAYLALSEWVNSRYYF